MKKIGVFTALLLIAHMLFAQSYEELMNQAKKAEAENKWATALGLYYDAVRINNEKPEAENRFAEIKEALKSGKPGLSLEEDIFTLNEKWIEVRKDFVTYFMNNCPWTFYFNNEFERVNLNTETKKADYKVYYTSRVSRKYQLLENIINAGSTEEAKEALPFYGDETRINIKSLTKTKTWSKEWYDELSSAVEKLNKNSAHKYYFGQEYKYGSKEQQYFFNVVNKTNFSKTDPSFEDILEVLNDYDAYSWVNLSVPPIATVCVFVTIGLYENDALIYEIPDILLSGCSLGRCGDKGERIEEIRKNDCESIKLKNIPQNIANKIEKKSIQYKILKAYIPYGFYVVTDDSKKISMKVGKTGNFEAFNSYGDLTAKNLDRMYKKYESLEKDSPSNLSSISVYKTNAFGEITYLLGFLDYRHFNKKDAEKTAKEYCAQGWELLKDSNEDYFKSFPNATSLFWTEDDLNNKKTKGERFLIFKKKYND